MKVKQLINRNGNPNANQFIITDGNRTIFQSYSSTCAIVEPNKITFGRDWDYSNTTMKHLYTFLNDYCGVSLNNSKEVRKAIKSGAYHNSVVVYDDELV